jgi:hypothetical protein
MKEENMFLNELFFTHYNIGIFKKKDSPATRLEVAELSLKFALRKKGKTEIGKNNS